MHALIDYVRLFVYQAKEKHPASGIVFGTDEALFDDDNADPAAVRSWLFVFHTHGLLCTVGRTSEIIPVSGSDNFGAAGRRC